MLTLARAHQARGGAGEPLPAVFRGLTANGVHIRQGQLTLVAAAPGCGKSLLALWLAVNAGVPALYFSADTDQATMANRAFAMVTGWRVEDIEHAVNSGATEALNVQAEKIGHVRFDFNAAPTPEHVEAELTAYVYAYGDWPRLIVVDNLSNLDLGGSGDYLALESACDYLHQLARETGAAVVALHHVTGSFDDGTGAVPLSGLRGKVSKVPELILTLHRKGGDAMAEEFGARVLGVCPVKNRTGRSDPSGSWSIPMQVDLERMAVNG